MNTKKIMIIDDEESVCSSLKILLGKKGYNVTTFTDAMSALNELKSNFYNIVITDLKMPLMDGISVMRAVKQTSQETSVIIMTAYATIETAIEATKEGADYIKKPFNHQELQILLDKILEHQQLRNENIKLRQELTSNYMFENIVGRNYQMKQLYSLIKTIASSDVTVLITGESGTGKELIANAIHYNSPRKNKPFLSLNCSALSEGLLESELFGHEKGAFTGAINEKMGRFELAQGGSIFLDEIGAVSPLIQIKLLRILQEKEYERVGGTKLIKADVRIIAATNENLEELIKKGEFREDMYYRLNVVSLHIPPLRERKDDIPLLAKYFLEKFSAKDNKQFKGIADDAMAVMLNYDWPGNVRELEHVIQRAVILANTPFINADHLPPNIKKGETKGIPSGKSKSLRKALEGYESNLISRVLEEVQGNKIKAAKILKVNRTTLYSKIRKYKLE